MHKHQHVYFAFALGVFALSAAPSFAVMNNGGGTGPGSDACNRSNGHAQCLGWCLTHNRTDKSLQQCAAQCDRYWCKAGGGSGRPAESGPLNGSRGNENAPIYRGPREGHGHDR